MKKVLLSFAFVASVLLSKAQEPLPFTENFDSGQLPTSDWIPSLVPPGQINVASYENPLASCANNPGGLVINPPFNEISAQDRISFLTPNLAYINANSLVTLRFNFFAFGSNSLTCNSQVSCNATVKVYLVNSNYNSAALPPADQIYGQSAVTSIQTSTSTTPTISISAAVASTIPANTTFRVLFDVESLGNCESPTRYVIDNINIIEVGQTVTPVSFKSFNASRNKSNVAISWTTASEQNNNGFYIQRNDGNGWKNVAFVFSQAAGGNSASDLDYSYSDPNNIKGVSQYRILQVDIDGKSRFSEIRSVKGEGQVSKVIVYPNPSSTGDINVVFDGQTARDVNVTDFSGRLIKKYSSVINNLEIKGLTSGVYSILVTEKLTGVKTVQKVVVR